MSVIMKTCNTFTNYSVPQLLMIFALAVVYNVLEQAQADRMTQMVELPLVVIQIHPLAMEMVMGMEIVMETEIVMGTEIVMETETLMEMETLMETEMGIIGLQVKKYCLSMNNFFS